MYTVNPNYTVIQKTGPPNTFCRIALPFHNFFTRKSTKYLRQLAAVNSNLIHVQPPLPAYAPYFVMLTSPCGMNSISASSIPQSDSGILVFVLVSKLLVDISSTNCDFLYHISCMYVIAKYRDINMNGY